MSHDLLIRRLDQKMVETATNALASPQGRDAFEYGRMSGLYAGLNEARNLVLDLISEEDDRDV